GPSPHPGPRNAAMDVGGTEQLDAEIERAMDHLARGFEIRALAEIVAAETDRRDAQAGGAEIANLHKLSPVRRREKGRILVHATYGSKALAGVVVMRSGRQKNCGPSQTRRLTGTALGRLIGDGGPDQTRGGA